LRTGLRPTLLDETDFECLASSKRKPTRLRKDAPWLKTMLAFAAKLAWRLQS
jgi:hypothetical protein